MAQTRLEIRTRVRDYLNEAVADLFSEAQLNRYFIEELRSLPSKNIYLEEIWQTTLDPLVDYSSGITLPENTFKVELLERNDGSSTNPHWNIYNGVDNYQDSIDLPSAPTTSLEIRAKLKKYFTEITDDTTSLDIPDDKTEVLVWGMVIRGYKQLIGYYQKSISWDSVTKPGGISLSVIQSWLRDAKSEYKDLVKQYSTNPRPRDIDLVS